MRTPRRKTTRRLLVTLLLVSAIAPISADRTVVADESDIQQAAREIADARERANRATDAYFQAESMIDSIDSESASLVRQIADLEKRVAALQKRVQRVAVNRFTRSSSTASPLFNGFNTVEEQMQVAALTAVITDTSEEDFDEYDSVTRDLVEKQKELFDNHARAQELQVTAKALLEQALAEVEHLKVVEAERLKDQAVRNALKAEERSRAAKAAAEAAQAEDAPEASLPADGSEARVINDDGGEDAASVVVLADNVGDGGQTGGGGAGGRPGGAGGDDYGGLGWVCPTGDSAVGFGDTWGAPRSGGRRHQGVDMIGPTGTPLLAVVDGVAVARDNELGGITISFFGSDGNRYYYAHLDSYGKLGAVNAGDVIGFMGDTGNAKSSTPHLHFEIHPGGGAAVNPYPTVRAHC